MYPIFKDLDQSRTTDSRAERSKFVDHDILAKSYFFQPNHYPAATKKYYKGAFLSCLLEKCLVIKEK